MRSLQQLVSVLAPGDTKAAARVTLAEEKPDAYVAKYTKDLAERGITKPVPNLAFVALLDALAAGKRVALIDHRAAPEDVLFALKPLKAPAKPTPGWARGIDPDDDRDPETVIAAAAHGYEARGVALLNLDTTSDQLAIVAVASDAVAAVKSAAKAAGVAIALIKPKPLQAPAPAARETPARAMETWPSAAEDPPGTWRYFLQLDEKRSLCLVKYVTAYDVHAHPLGSESTRDKRGFPDAATCTAAYLTHIEQLRADGWQQYEADEHAKALRGARKR
jgi:hypothetical protein